MERMIFIDTELSVITVHWANRLKRAILPSSAFTLSHAGRIYVVHRVDGPAETNYLYNKVSYYNYFNGYPIQSL